LQQAIVILSLENSTKVFLVGEWGSVGWGWYGFGGWWGASLNLLIKAAKQVAVVVVRIITIEITVARRRGLFSQ